MFYYIKESAEGSFLSASSKRPRNLEGLIELTEEEYLAKLAELAPAEQEEVIAEEEEVGYEDNEL